MAEVIVDGRTSRLPPAASGNGGGDFVVVWNDLGGTNLKGRILGANGQPAGPAFPIADNAGGTHMLPACAMLVGLAPGFAVAWIAQGQGRTDVLLQRFAPDGTRRGQVVRVNSSDVNPDHPPALMRLMDSNFVVSWGAARLDQGIRARIFTPEGENVRPEFPVNTSQGVHFAPVGTELDDDGFVIAWQGGQSIGRTFVRLQMFQPDGTPSGTELTPNALGGANDLAITMLAAPPDAEPGHFAIAHVVGFGGEESIVVVSLFGPAGIMKHATNVTHRDDQTIASQVAMRTLPNQRLVVTWTERFVAHVGDRTEDNVKARTLFEQTVTSGPPESPVVDGILVPVSAATQVHASGDGNQNHSCVATMLGDAGERIAVAWIDDRPAGSEASVRAVKANVLSGALVAV